MKKIILFLFLIVNILIFINVREAFFEKDEIEMMNGNAGHYRLALVIDNLSNESITIEESDLIFEKIDELTRSHNITVTLHDFSENENRMNRFVASHGSIDEIFNLTTDQSLNFNVETTYFYTNRQDVENGVNFFLLNDQLEVNFYPLRDLGIVVGGFYNFFSNDQEELNRAVELFMTEFGNYVSQTWEVEQLPQQEINSDFASRINSFFTLTIYISTVLAFLLILLYIHLQSKKITIHKTMGHSFLTLVKEIFFPLTMMILLTIITIQTILFVTIIGAFNERTIPIITFLVNAVYYQTLGVMASIAVSSLLLLFIPLYALIKNKNFTRMLMTANYLTKIILLVAMLPLLSERITLMSNNMDYIRLIYHYERYGNISDYQFSPGPLLQYGNDGHTTLMMQLSQSEIDELSSDIIYEYELLYEYHNAYRILDEAGAILVQTTEFSSGEPVMNVNENFIRKHPIIDLNGSIVDLNPRTEDIVNLIPEDYKGMTFVADMYRRDEGVIYIQNEQTNFDYSLEWANWGIVRRPYVISVRMDDSFELWATPFMNVFYNGDFNEVLQDTMFYNRIQISTIGDELNGIRDRHLTQIRDHLFVIIPILTLIVLISIQYTYLYVKVYQKRIYSNKIMGHNDFRIFLQLFVELTIGVLASMSLAWYLSIDFRLLFFVILLDFIVYLGIIGWSRFGKSFKFVENG